MSEQSEQYALGLRLNACAGRGTFIPMVVILMTTHPLAIGMTLPFQSGIPKTWTANL